MPPSKTTRSTLTTVLLTGLGLSLPTSSLATGPSQKTLEAFDHYIQIVEARDNAELANDKPFLWIDQLPDSERQQYYAALTQGKPSYAVPNRANRDAPPLPAG